MIDIHRPNHRVSAFRAVRDRMRAGLASIAGIGVGRIDDDRSMRFAFIVGCGHSGTSLLASRLGLHRDAWLVDGESYALVPIRSARACRRTVRAWTAGARAAQRTLVLEKTPKHVHSIARIRRMLPDARFLATARDPLENIASMKKRYGSLELAIERWNLDGAATAAAVESGVAELVRYEEMTRDPASTLRRAAAHLGLAWDEGVLAEGRTAYREASNLMAERLAQVTQPISDRGSRWREILTEAEAAEAFARTAEVARRLGYGGGPPESRSASPRP